jgi:hypothetical protein
LATCSWTYIWPKNPNPRKKRETIYRAKSIFITLPTCVCPINVRFSIGKAFLALRGSENVWSDCFRTPHGTSTSKYSTGSGRPSRWTSIPNSSFS